MGGRRRMQRTFRISDSEPHVRRLFKRYRQSLREDNIKSDCRGIHCDLEKQTEVNKHIVKCHTYFRDVRNAGGDFQ
jgi:hypothetical protein